MFSVRIIRFSTKFPSLLLHLFVLKYEGENRLLLLRAYSTELVDTKRSQEVKFIPKERLVRRRISSFFSFIPSMDSNNFCSTTPPSGKKVEVLNGFEDICGKFAPEPFTPDISSLFLFLLAYDTAKFAAIEKYSVGVKPTLVIKVKR